MVAAGLCLVNPPAWPPAEPAASAWPTDAWRVARVSCAAAAWSAPCSCCRWLPGPWSALPGLQLFAGQLLQRLQLFAAWSIAAAAVICCLVLAAWWLPSAAWSLVRVPGAGGHRPSWSRSCCLLPGPGAGGCLVPVAAWPCLCLCSWSARVCDPGPRFTNIRTARPGPRALVRAPGCLVRGHRPARPGA